MQTAQEKEAKAQLILQMSDQEQLSNSLDSD